MASPHAALKGPALCGISRGWHPEVPNASIAWSDRKKCHVIPGSWKWSRPSPLPSPVVMPSSPKRPHPNAAPGTQQAQLQRWTRPSADYPHPETMEPPQGGPNLFAPWDQATAFEPLPATSLLHLQLLRSYVGVSPELSSRVLRTLH